jgi:hypothetical protein
MDMPLVDWVKSSIKTPDFFFSSLHTSILHEKLQLANNPITYKQQKTTPKRCILL